MGSAGAALRAAAATGALRVVPAALAAWGLRFPTLEPRLSLEAVQQLERSEGQLDRLWQRQGAAAELVVGLILDSDGLDDSRLRARVGGARVTQARSIESLGYFVGGLRAIGREQLRKSRGRAQPKSWRPRRPGGSAGWVG